MKIYFLVMKGKKCNNENKTEAVMDVEQVCEKQNQPNNDNLALCSLIWIDASLSPLSSVIVSALNDSWVKAVRRVLSSLNVKPSLLLKENNSLS